MKSILFTALFIFGIISISNVLAIEGDQLKNQTSPKVDHSIFDNLLKEHVTASGEVDYKAFQSKQVLFKQYQNQLSSANPYAKNWSKNDKLAFWINVYNAFTIQLIIDHMPIESIKDIRGPWNKKFFTIAGEEMDLNHVEHDILRKMGEPRIHFAIVCASFSCPQLRNEAYTSVKLEQQLQSQSVQFINDPKRNKISKDEVNLSKIFDWFTKDFTSNGSLISFLNQYSKVKINESAKINWLDYNWSLND
jgi:hypothetical protein